MPDYGHDLLFGSFIPPAAERADEVVRLAELTDQLGLDLVSVQDHPYQPAFLETWTLLSVIAARTHRVTVLPNVVNLPLRPPAVLARSTASLDVLSGGRVELGLGAGAFWDAIAGMGGPRRSPAEAVAALAEAIEVIRALWQPGRGVRIDGQHYWLAGAKPGPAPAHPIGIWLGALGRRMLQLTGRTADGWVISSPYVPPEQLAEKNRIIDGAARAAGRDPAAVRRLYNITGSFAGGDAEAGFLAGPPQVWAEQLAELAVTEGLGGYILMAELDDDTGLRRFAEEVVPAVRELVAKERTAPATSAAPAIAATVGLGVTSTPDPGERLSQERVWDETRRPSGPALDPDATYTKAGRAGAQHLIEVHDHFRTELQQLRDLIRQVATGDVDVGTARAAINTMTIRQNRWTLGTYCESYCRAVTAHHTLEDAALFPRLRRADPRLVPVIDRLAEEHEAIAGVLERVDAALVTMVSHPHQGLADVQAAVDLLTDTLLSHLSYEERKLVEPIARLAAG